MALLNQIPRGSFDHGNDTARKTAIKQMQFIRDNYPKFLEHAKGCRPAGWKERKFSELRVKLNNKEQLDMKEYNYIDEFYEGTISLVYKVPGYKKEFFKGHRR